MRGWACSQDYIYTNHISNHIHATHTYIAILVYELFPCGRNGVLYLRPYHFLENTNRWRLSNSLTRLGPLWNYVNKRPTWVSLPIFIPRHRNRRSQNVLSFTWWLVVFLTTSCHHFAIQARLQVVSPDPSSVIWERDYIENQGTPLKNRCLPFIIHPGHVPRDSGTRL